MKTNEQILRHLFNCKFSDEDWLQVLCYCHEHDIKGMHRAMVPKSQSTYEQFTQWLEGGLGVGDIITINGIAYMIGDDMPDYSYAIARLNADGLSVKERKIDLQSFSLPTDGEIQKFHEAVRNSGMVLNASLARLTKIYSPKKWESTCVEVEGIARYGVVSDNTDGKVTFLFLVDEETLHENVTVETDTPITPVKRGDIVRMEELLQSHGLRWNAKGKCLEPNCQRADKGGTYWYISDVFSVRNGKERNTAIDRMRWQAGNYFLKHEDALEMLMGMQRLRAKMTAQK